jgi:hypothetical protein
MCRAHVHGGSKDSMNNVDERPFRMTPSGTQQCAVYGLGSLIMIGNVDAPMLACRKPHMH